MSKKKKDTNNLKAAVQTLGYLGTVSITLKNYKKILVKKIAHNTGKGSLFNFLALCLAGEYKAAESLRPIFIKLFYNNARTVEAAKANIKDWVNIEASTSLIPMNTTPVVTVDLDDSNKYTTTLHFKVSYSYFLSSAQKVNQLCLYRKDITSGGDADYSAVYLLTKNDGQELDPIALSNLGQNYSLIVEWTLAVTNK